MIFSQEADSIIFRDSSSVEIKSLNIKTSGESIKIDSINNVLENEINWENYPIGPIGTVYIKFTVEADGSITHIQVLRGIDESINKEAIRLVESLSTLNTNDLGKLPCEFNLPMKFINRE